LKFFRWQPVGLAGRNDNLRQVCLKFYPNSPAIFSGVCIPGGVNTLIQ
jgi:hypothetical protein